MRKIISATLILAVMISCMHKSGSGNIITQTKSVGPFKKLDVSGSFEVEVRNGAAGNVLVEADDNLMKYIVAEVDGNELDIRLKRINVSDAHLKVLITAPEIDKINASAAANIKVKDELRSPGTISLTASSGAYIKAALDAPGINAEASSSGELNLSGRTRDLHASGSSGASITARELMSENSYINASSGGTVHVNVSVSVDATASSGGNISYRGVAPVVKKSESSGGKVEKD